MGASPLVPGAADAVGGEQIDEPVLGDADPRIGIGVGVDRGVVDLDRYLDPLGARRRSQIRYAIFDQPADIEARLPQRRAAHLELRPVEHAPRQCAGARRGVMTVLRILPQLLRRQPVPIGIHRISIELLLIDGKR
jgi:hypothetical protein